MVTAILVILFTPIIMIAYAAALACEKHNKKSKEQYEQARRNAVESMKREDREYNDWGWPDEK